VPEGWETIDAPFKDPDAQWVGITVNLIAYTYNSERVRPAAIPQSALDFLQPQFRGKAVTPYPADDDVTLYRFYTIVQRYGCEFMDRYVAKRAEFHPGSSRRIALDLRRRQPRDLRHDRRAHPSREGRGKAGGARVPEP
jgi:ABC-type Fe3+ transport system substrate-binding protein